MCGIVAIAGHRFGRDALQRGVDVLHHRGPDGSGTWVDAERAVGLGHARLAVIDLETGDQPLLDPTGDLVLVCNGEIYDHERIRARLQQAGHRFTTDSDSEVILHLYRAHGLDFVEHLRGEFAFVLYDRVERRLLAVRDRFGIKPLFYNEQGGRWLFGSEAKALFATGLLEPRIDPVAVRNVLSRAMEDSIFSGVSAVPPGTMLQVDVGRGANRMIRYWDLPLDAEAPEAERPEPAEYERLVREQVDEAVRLRLRADVPVGVYLSGGIDSAIVAESAVRQRGAPLEAFTIGFPDAPGVDESQLAQLTADHVGVKLHTVQADRHDLLDHFEDCLWQTEVPLSCLRGVGKFLLSRLAAEHVKVVLTGEGSDEVFLGYHYYKRGDPRARGAGGPLRSRRAALVARIERRLGFVPPRWFVRPMDARSQRRLARLFDPRHHGLLADHDAIEALCQGVPRGRIEDLPYPKQMQYYAAKRYLGPYNLVVLSDRQEMAHSLEGRTPFLDHVLVEAAQTIPTDLKVRDGVEKFVLREAMRGRVHPRIRERTKFAYAAPGVSVRRRTSQRLGDLVDRYASPQALRAAGLFDSRRMGPLFEETAPGLLGLRRSEPVRHELLTVLSVQILEKLFVQGFGARVRDASARAEAGRRRRRAGAAPPSPGARLDGAAAP